MKIINRYKNIRRYEEIVFVFVKHGFGTIIDRLGIFKHLSISKKAIRDKEDKNVTKFTIGKRLRMALEELGPTFIKLGQVISTRQDIIPDYIIYELQKLQDNVPAFSFNEVKEQIEKELGDSLENLFEQFNEKPLGAASIAQVHTAILKTGEKVVVKVQRPKTENKVRIDLNILYDLAQFVDVHTKYGKLYDFRKMVKGFQTILLDELDFTKEAANAETFKKNFENQINIMVPNIYWNYTTKRVLTMEYIDGISLNNIAKIKKVGLDTKIIGKRFTTSIINQILKDGFFHGDPHPGNIMALDNNKIVFLDLGMVGKLSKHRKKQFLKMFLGITFRDSKLIIEAIIDLNAISKRSNIRKFEKEIECLLDKYLEMPISEMKIEEIFKEIFTLAFSFNIKIPTEFTMLAKTLVTVEGQLEKLDPELNIFEIAEPIARNLMLTVFSFKETSREFFQQSMGYARLIKEFPFLTLNFLRKMEDEDFTMYFEFKSFNKLIKHFEKVANRISFSIILLGLSIIISGLIIGSGLAANTGTEMSIFSIRLLKFGLITAVVMVGCIIISIISSNRH